MKKIFLSRKFLSGTLSLFALLFFVSTSSFFFFVKDANAVTCNGGAGTCLPSCAGGDTETTDLVNCQLFACCTPQTPLPATNGCSNGTCMVGGCAGFTTLGNCTGPDTGKACCSTQPAPTQSATAAPAAGTCPVSDFTGGLVLCGKGDNPEDCNFEAFICLLQRIMNFLLFVLAVPLAAISFAFIGFQMMVDSAQGKDVRGLKGTFMTVVFGLCIMLAAWLIVHAIVKGLGVAETYNFLGG